MLWTGAIKKPSARDWRGGQSLPHGQFKLDGKCRAAHRVSFMFAHGHEGCTMAFFGLLEHTCDNPRCVEWTHLIESDYSANLKSAYDRGRREREVLVELCDWFEAQGTLVAE